MLKKLIILGMLAVTNAWALPDPLLVLDARNADNVPKRFRADLVSHSAGSAQFSERGLLSAIDRMRTKKVTIVDLRQESHGYLNGNAISWYGKHDAANAGLTSDEVSHREANLLTALAKKKTATVYHIDTKTPDGTITSAKSQEYAVHTVLSEEDMAGKHHFGYQRIYVQDFHAPHPKAVDLFLKLVAGLPHDKWLYFHCRAGSGRTTTFMTMYDMLLHAKTDSFGTIIARQYKLGGKDLTKLPDPDEYKYQAALERLNFLRKFYEYAKDRDVNSSVQWSEWLKQHSK